MVYRNRLVAVVKVNGKVLRETDGAVTLPFGSEYSILIKNMNSVRAQVKVSIDGTDATEDTWLVIAPNSEMELERFIKNGNLSRGNRFKFIERTGDIEEHRGIKAEDGLVRVEYKFEKLKPIVREVEEHHNIYDHHYYPWPRYIYPQSPWYYPQRPHITFTNSAAGSRRPQAPTRSLGISGQSCGWQAAQDTQVYYNATCASGEAERGSVCQDFNDAGITVAGSESHQQFQHVSDFSTEQSEVLVLKLRGSVADAAVKAPIAVSTKVQCSTCGRNAKSNAQFCSKCGTALKPI